MSGQIAIYEVATGEVVQTLTPPPATTSEALFQNTDSYVGALSFSPDGTKLVVASMETGAIFDVRSGRQVGHPTGWGTAATNAFFTPDGGLVVVSGFNPQQTFTFDPDTGDQVGDPITDAYAAANGPPGTLVITNHAGIVRVIDLATHEPVGPPIAVRGETVAFMHALPDGAQILIAYASGLQMFDIATARAIGDPFPSRGPFGVASPSPDGKALVAFDGTHLMRWNLDHATWPGIACRAAGRNLTHAEWAQYLPNAGPYRPTCPNHPT